MVLTELINKGEFLEFSLCPKCKTEWEDFLIREIAQNVMSDTSNPRWSALKAVFKGFPLRIMVNKKTNKIL